MSTDERFQNIVQLIKARAYQEAYQELQSYLKEHPDHARAWYLLSFFAPTPQQKIQALQQSLQLDPESSRARWRLARLSATNKRWRSRFVLVSGLFIFVAAVVIGGVLLLDRQPNDPDRPVPTLFQPDPPAVAYIPSWTPPLPTLTPDALDTSLPAPDQSPTPSETATVARATQTRTPTGVPLSQTPGITRTNTPSATVVTTAPQRSASPTPTVRPSSTVGVVLPAATLFVSPTPTVTVPILPSPSQLPTLPAATMVPPDEIIPLNVQATVGEGQMMVVNAVRPAATLIRDLGGTAPAAPAGSQWLLVELLVQCGNSTCSLASSPIQVTDGSEAAYLPAAALIIDPTFGPASVVNQQAWGYLGFIVPQNPQPLYLIVISGSTQYNFALQ